MNKQQLIEKLSLEPHIEGGYFSRTYKSDLTTSVSYDTKPRCLLSSIYYMLTDDSPIDHLHKTHGHNTPKQAPGYYALRLAGLFNLPISLHFVMEIGVSRVNPTLFIAFRAALL